MSSTTATLFPHLFPQELVDKAPALPPDVAWHFIGHLQSNKVKVLLEGVPSLAMVETVDSEKLASRLDAAVAALARPPLAVMVQVNTSGEESKYGLDPGEAVVCLARHVAEQCPHLRLAGLMTIGMPDYSSRPENFTCLADCRRQVAAALGLQEGELELSMGMSGDFEQVGWSHMGLCAMLWGADKDWVGGVAPHCLPPAPAACLPAHNAAVWSHCPPPPPAVQAIEMGSTNIRVGSTIFGARVYNH